MSLGGMLGSLLILITGLLIIARPWWNANKQALQQGKRIDAEDCDKLIIRYERILAAIRELDEDFGTGKISQENYADEREVWARQGVAALQALEKSGVKIKELGRARGKHRNASGAAEAKLDAAIEQAVTDYASAMHPSKTR